MTAADGLSSGTFAFLEGLSANNSRVWFDANRTAYERDVKAPAAVLRGHLEVSLGDLAGRPLTSKIFRITRDVRFSADKTPYAPHIRMAFWPEGAAFEGKDAQPPSFFLSVEADHIRLGAGALRFSKPVLAAYLAGLKDTLGPDLAGKLTVLEETGFEISEPDLARVPRGFDRDHPQARLARHKGLAVWRRLDDTRAVQGTAAVSRLITAWQPVLPFWKTLTALQETT